MRIHNPEIVSHFLKNLNYLQYELEDAMVPVIDPFFFLCKNLNVNSILKTAAKRLVYWVIQKSRTILKRYSS